MANCNFAAPGRIVLGVGVGGEDRHEMEVCGVDPATRGARTNHSLAALEGLLSGDVSSYQCEFFDFEDALIKPAPSPRIPILVGGRSNAAIRRETVGWLTFRRFAPAERLPASATATKSRNPSHSSMKNNV